MLLLAGLGAVAGASIWLTLATDRGAGPVAPPGPNAELRLGATTSKGAPAAKPAGAAPRSGKQATPKQARPKQAEPKQSAPKQAAPKQAAPKQAAAKQATAKQATAKKTTPGVKAAAKASGPSPKPKSTGNRPGEPAPAQSEGARPKPVASPAPHPAPTPSVSTRPLPAGLTLPRIATGPPLSIAHDPTLSQKGEFGLLPIISADGRKPWQVYARPFDQNDKRPRIAIVISDLGHSAAETQAAIQGLPGAVTLAFSPYVRRLGEMIRRARTAGHEILLNVPMEPVDFPVADPGQQTLLTSLEPAQNDRRLMWALGRVTGYVGIVDHWGSRFTASSSHMLPVLAALNARGLIFLDSRASTRSATPEVARSIGLPWAISSHFIDQQASRDKIDARLHELEAIARHKGNAVGIGSPYPVTLERIAAWVNGAGRRGIALAPVSAIVAGDGSG